jgi:hypothetical protein
MVGTAVVNSLLNIEAEFCRYLYLREVAEPRDNRLCVVVKEAGADASPDSRLIAGVEFSQGQAIQSNENSRPFEIMSENSIACNAVKESCVRVCEYNVEPFG